MQANNRRPKKRKKRFWRWAGCAIVAGIILVSIDYFGYPYGAAPGGKVVNRGV